MTPQFVRVALTMDDGSTGIMAFVTRGRSAVLPSGALMLSTSQGLWTREPTPENIQAEIDRAFPGVDILGGALPKVLSWSLIAETDIPADRTYRDAWERQGNKIGHNMAKARNLHRDLLRAERAVKFIELDGQWMRAVGQNNKPEADAIEVERQKWRDAPADPRIEAAQTIEELKEIKP